ncbi:hypothetical protein [Streptomyces sp. NPDC000410]|uniref:hypothetical protein n=1 Tax=Streptomyces sp. NPDC000410 TaxID=3154254 RepID=UPI003318F751
MRRIPALNSTVARSSRRLRLTLAVTALAAVTLSACGTEKTTADGSGSGSRNKPANSVGAQPGAASGSPEQAAFMEMMDRVARPCPSDAPSDEPIASGGPRTGPLEPLPPGETVPADTLPIAPTEGPETVLNAFEWCAAHLHVERVTHALAEVADPTPAQVGKVLNDLGYIDERIHGLKQSGSTTRFLIDLRIRGGKLGLEGSAAGANTDIEFVAGPATGPFTPVQRRQ